MVYDVITYNGEKELFEIRYNILKDYVDQFIVVEFDKTFSGKSKPWRFTEDFKGYKFKNVCYHGIEEKDYIKYKELAESSPNTVGADHWKREFMQKEFIKDVLVIHHLKDDDIVFIGDVDEIWNPENLENITAYLKDHRIYKLKQLMYVYYLNNKTSEQWYGTVVSRYKNIINKCLNHVRSNEHTKWVDALDGWHFSSMHSQIERKLTDSYTLDSYASPQVMANLQENVKNNKDFLGRGFTYTTDESELPEYILSTKEKYKHLWKQ